MQDSQESKTDVLTVAAISIVVFVIANVLHEGLGHGIAAFLLGARLETLTSMSLAYDSAGLSQASTRLIAAAGTVVNLLMAGVAFAALRTTNSTAIPYRFFLWLLATVNLLQGTGYLLFSGVGNIGDWAVFIQGWRPWWLWRLILAVIGGASYWWSVRFALLGLAPYFGANPINRIRRAYVLMLVPYFTGAGLYILAGLLNPAGALLVAVSAAASSLGGTCGLAWGPQLLKDPRFAMTRVDHGALDRDWRWLLAACAVGIPFVVVLGPGLAL